MKVKPLVVCHSCCSVKKERDTHENKCLEASCFLLNNNTYYECVSLKKFVLKTVLLGHWQHNYPLEPREPP